MRRKVSEASRRTTTKPAFTHWNNYSNLLNSETMKLVFTHWNDETNLYTQKQLRKPSRNNKLNQPSHTRKQSNQSSHNMEQLLYKVSQSETLKQTLTHWNNQTRLHTLKKWNNKTSIHTTIKPAFTLWNNQINLLNNATSLHTLKQWNKRWSNKINFYTPKQARLWNKPYLRNLDFAL